jgi:hypothetical protein
MKDNAFLRTLTSIPVFEEWAPSLTNKSDQQSESLCCVSNGDDTLTV